MTLAFQDRRCSPISSNQTNICLDSPPPTRTSSSIFRNLCGFGSRSLPSCASSRCILAIAIWLMSSAICRHLHCCCGRNSRSQCPFAATPVKWTAAHKVRRKTRGSSVLLTCTCGDCGQTAKSTPNNSHQGPTRPTPIMVFKEQHRTRNNFEAPFPTPGRQRSRGLKMKSEEDVRQNLLMLKRLKFNCSALC